MKGKEFITMMRQDIETHPNKEVLKSVVDVMEAVVAQHPFADIDAKDKTPESCFKAMSEYAKKHQKNGSFYFTPSVSMAFISEYLGLGKVESEVNNAGVISLADFL